MTTGSPLLSTKLLVPTLPPRAVARPRLQALLTSLCERRLTLVSAPPGFGKSTLLAQWAGQSACPVAWLSLDEADNDPGRFWRYFAAALSSLWPHLGQSLTLALQSPQPPPAEAMLAALVNDLATAPDDFALVLDDLHAVQAPPIQNALAYLVENLPPRVHLVIATRADPPFPLPRLRARGQLAEIRAEDLRFSAAEAAAFLSETMRLGLSDGQVAALVARTEGWVAGLQLAALALQARAGDEETDQFIAAFAGSHRYVLDYLVEEVLGRQTPEVHAFLLQTSLLERLAAPLCDALTGAGNGQEMLACLESANLFLVPLDAERRWYRYHRLFADLLRTRLGQRSAAEMSDLHGRASRWFEANGHIAEAVHHALAGGDSARAAGMVEKVVMPLLQRGEISTVLGWLGALPADLIRDRPWLSYYFAWNLLLSGRGQEAETWLQAAETGAGRLGDDAGRRAFSGHLASLRAYLLAMQAKAAETVEQARLALEHLPGDDVGMRSLVAFVLGGACILKSDISGAVAAFAEAGRLARESGNAHVGVPALASQGGCHAMMGSLRRAKATYEDALRLAEEAGGRQSPLAARPYTGLSDLHYEWNELEQAGNYAREAVRLGRVWGNLDVLVRAHLTVAQVELALGNTAAAEEAFAEADGSAGRHLVNPGLQVVLAAGRGRLWFALGRTRDGARWAEESGLAAMPVSAMTEVAQLVVARGLMASGREESLRAALALLERLRQAAEEGGRTGRLVGVLAARSHALALLGQRQEAQADLSRALSIGTPEGFVRTFVDEGPALAPLLVELAGRGQTREYATSLLGHFSGGLTAPAPPPPSPAGLLEPLSEREREVLRLIAAGHGNEAIARDLVVATSTVKSHVNHIFGKLGVSSRTQAVARARELGIL